MEAKSTSETSVNFYQTTRRYNPKDSRLCNRRRENLKSHLWNDFLYRQSGISQLNSDLLKVNFLRDVPKPFPHASTSVQTISANKLSFQVTEPRSSARSVSAHSGDTRLKSRPGSGYYNWGFRGLPLSLRANVLWRLKVGCDSFIFSFLFRRYITCTLNTVS
jgi:hypothetical protein